MSRDEIVEAVVVDAGQAVGAVGVGPDPGLESRLDLGELVLGCLRVGGVEDALLDAVLDEEIIDLRQRRIEGVLKRSRRGGVRCPIRPWTSRRARRH